jgi:AraC family transcriptional regulator, transcriptional activator of the genes for pyochelin and ferripyochelin receptors
MQQIVSAVIDIGERAEPALVTLVGDAPLPDAPGLAQACALVFGEESGAPPALHLAPEARAALASPAGATRRLVILVKRQALMALGGGGLLAETGDFHFGSELRRLVMAIANPDIPPAAQGVYRQAKALEAVYEAIQQHAAGKLIPLVRESPLSADDTRRVISAKRLIDERCGEKLTLTKIARNCGLNRAKLTRGFKDLFDCTVAEALMAARLERASHMLLTTDLSVACIGYENGYENNSSFARAFCRRYGRSPTSYRTRILAA